MTQAILLIVYALVAAVFLDTTHREGANGLRRGWDGMRVIGLIYCLFWPVILLHVGLVAYRDRHARQAVPPVARPPAPVEVVKPPVRHEKPRIERKRALDPTQTGL